MGRNLPPIWVLLSAILAACAGISKGVLVLAGGVPVLPGGVPVLPGGMPSNGAVVLNIRELPGQVNAESSWIVCWY